jgi:hypothetical protein
MTFRMADLTQLGAEWMPTSGPMGLRVDAGMRHHSLFTVFLVPPRGRAKRCCPKPLRFLAQPKVESSASNIIPTCQSRQANPLARA